MAICQQMVIILHHGTTARSIRNDRVYIGWELVQRFARHVTCSMFLPGMAGQRAAAALVTWDYDFDAIMGQDAHCCGIYLWVQYRLYATDQQCNSCPAWAFGWDNLRSGHMSGWTSAAGSDSASAGNRTQLFPWPRLL